MFDEPISIFEVQQVVKDAKLNKKSGTDNIPVEVLNMIFQFFMSCIMLFYGRNHSVRMGKRCNQPYSKI